MNLFGSVDRPWVLAIAGAAVLALNLLFLAGGYASVMRRRTGRRLPEGEWRIWRPSYSVAELRRYLLDAGEGGWHAYRLQLAWDVVYAVLLGLSGLVLLGGLMALAFGDGHWWVVLLTLTPAAAALADVGEDGALFAAVGRDPSSPPGPPVARPELVPVASWLTRVKFVLYAAASAVALVTVVRLVQRGP